MYGVFISAAEFCSEEQADNLSKKQANYGLMTAAPKSRWFAFRLRTLFIATALFACWLGWVAHQVREREKFAQFLEDSPEHQDSTMAIMAVLGSQAENIPIVWRWLGAKPVLSILRTNVTETDYRRAQQLFPEAIVEFYPPKDVARN